MGGLGKQVGAHPDVLHSYFALAGLALVGRHSLLPLDPALGVTLRAKRAAGLDAGTADAPCAPCAPCEPPCEPIGVSIAQMASTAVWRAPPAAALAAT